MSDLTDPENKTFNISASPSSGQSAEATPKPTDRIAWLDVARALGIALVVFGHVERGLTSAGILHMGTWKQIDFMIYTFHMPLFFYLSGMNVMRSRAKPGFFARRAKGILIPYFVFSLLQGTVQVVMSGQTNGDLTWQDLSMIFVAPLTPFWFLYVLLIYVALVSLWRPGAWMMALAVLMTLSSPLAGAEGRGFPLFEILYFFSFYLAGVLFPSRRLPVWIGVPAILVWLGAGVTALSQGVAVDDYYALFMLPAAIGGILGLLWVAQQMEAWTRLLAGMGRNVMAIYVMHILAAAGTRIILMKAGVDQPLPQIVLGTLAGILLPLLALWIMQKLKVASLVGLPAR